VISTRREREVLNAIAQLHEEFGLEHRFTSLAIAHVVGAAPGSLAGLTMSGYVTQRAGDDKAEGMTYQITPAGLALARSAMHSGVKLDGLAKNN